jgi:hypothetical protein
MTEHDTNLPLEPDPDPMLDRHLASLGRYAPAPGFADRVMARVRVAPAPLAPAPAIRPARRRRWPVLAGALSGTAAVSSTALTMWAVWHSQVVISWPVAMLTAFGLPAWHWLLDWLTAHSAALGAAVLRDILAGRIPSLAAWVLAASLATPLCAVALWQIARTPARMRTYAAR